jgi:ABC-type multidrug transport system fused ATPase/permease subunit
MDNEKKESNIFDDFNNLFDHFNKLKEKKGFKTFFPIILIVVFGIVIEWMNSNGDMMIFFAVVLMFFIIYYIFCKVSRALGVLMTIIFIFALLFFSMRGTYDTVISKKNKADNESFTSYATGEKLITKIQNKHKDNDEQRGEKVDTELSKGETGNFDGSLEIYAESKKEQKMIVYKKDSIDVTIDKDDQKRREWMEPKKGYETVRNDQQVKYQKQVPISIQSSPSFWFL